MSADVSELLAELAEENAALEELLVSVEAESWTTETPAEGWAVRDQVSHLEFVDRRGLLAATDPERFAEQIVIDRSDSGEFARLQLELGRTTPPHGVIERWQAGRTALLSALADLDPSTRLPWYGPPMSIRSFATARLMEAFAHGVDIRDALGAPLAPTRRLRHVAHLGWLTRGWSYNIRGLEPSTAPISVELTHEGETFKYGDDHAEQFVRGPLADFCLVVTQRRHLDDTSLVWHGADADAWLRIAQAFAGSPGPGRPPTSR